MDLLQPTGAFQNLSAGNYTVTVTDFNNCTATTTITLTANPPLVVNANPTNSTCGNSNGSLIAGAVGGNNPYGYSLNGGPGQGSASFTNLIAGNYTVIATDQDGCTASINVIIPDEPGPVITSLTSNEVTCFGGSNGSITSNVTGGTNPLHYSLNNGPFQSSSTFPNLSAGSYSVTVQDANGCTTVANIVISPTYGCPITMVCY